MRVENTKLTGLYFTNMIHKTYLVGLSIIAVAVLAGLGVVTPETALTFISGLLGLGVITSRQAIAKLANGKK